MQFPVYECILLKLYRGQHAFLNTLSHRNIIFLIMNECNHVLNNGQVPRLVHFFKF